MPKMIFHKMVSAGNDFIVINHRGRRIKNVPKFSREVCHPHFGVGADGVVLLERSRKADLKMRIINADGSEAEMCGNATRCTALYANRVLHLGKRLALETMAGVIGTRISGKRIRSAFALPRHYRSRSKISVNGRSYSFYSVNTGVPHVVMFRKTLDRFPVVEMGRMIRYHRTFKPKGTNVNFVTVRGPRRLDIRTYERGVENETLACGTGVTAAAVVSGVEGYCRPPVTVHTRSGENLVVDFKQSGGAVCALTLEGTARFICKGTLV